MRISPFPLPSNLKKVIHFRAPNVDDALQFIDLDPDCEEQSTTQYLDYMQDKSKQDGKVHDSLEWTAEDRRTALWWIFISTNEQPSMAVNYHCDHCDEDHYVDVSMTDLAENAQVLSKSPVAYIDALFDDKQIKSIVVKPLDGFSAERLETIRNERDFHEENTSDWHNADNYLIISEIACSLTFPDQPDDKDEAHEYKVNLIKKMAVDTEFRSLCAKVERALRGMQHGLLMRYKNAQLLLVASVKNCSKAIDNGEDESKLLLLPFRHYDYFPTL